MLQLWQLDSHWHMNMWSLISPVRSQGCQFIQNDKASTNSPSHKNWDGSVLGGGSEVPLITPQHDQWPSDHRRIDRARRQSVLSPSLRNFITLAYLFAPLAHSQLFRSVPPKNKQSRLWHWPPPVCVYIRSTHYFDTDVKAVKLLTRTILYR